ncbi:MAG TPA: tRNA preQ1(34) S-adenosylmethionine ribosyltransferase-isomerase QueA [Planctomycetota bacterium]|nr:tRNA preQ1(34) S-adenosylmethionine ribosyltransferase-isomerase QueA [Planctomycetota bacterium]
MRLGDFDYELPPDRIAARPVEPRDASRLLVVRRDGAPFEDRRFSDLPDLLDAGDLLVVNDTRVIPARLDGRRADTGGRVEVFLLRPVGPLRWRVLLSPARRFQPGVRVAFPDGVACVVEAVEGSGERTVVFEGTDDVTALAERIGATPLPPYIRRPVDEADRAAYQTVFARAPGAVAAPTAGLHFTPSLLDRLRGRGVRIAQVTLHVGPGTFRPVVVDDVDAHRMDAEPYDVPAYTAEAVAETRAAGQRVVAVGTTSVRTLEAAAAPDGSIRAGPGATDLFVRPGYTFRAVTALVTNFHLPRSTLLLLVCAFGGRDRVLSAYEHALGQGYRFYSYGDAMLLL